MLEINIPPRINNYHTLNSCNESAEVQTLGALCQNCEYDIVVLVSLSGEHTNTVAGAQVASCGCI